MIHVVFAVNNNTVLCSVDDERHVSPSSEYKKNLQIVRQKPPMQREQAKAKRIP